MIVDELLGREPKVPIHGIVCQPEIMIQNGDARARKPSKYWTLLMLLHYARIVDDEAENHTWS